MKKKNVILGRLLMLVGSLLVLSALLLFGYNRRQERMAEKMSDAVLLAMQQQMEQNIAAAEGRQQPIQQMELDGARYLGMLELPTLGMTLPVQADWSYEKLRSTPCVYSGSIQDGGLVILGHNYRRHFGPIDRLRPGDEVILIDAAGNRFQYKTEELLVLDAAQVDEMIDPEYDLSLFTCNYDGKARITVRCSLQNEADRFPMITETPQSFAQSSQSTEKADDSEL